jgi:hypothetical protein
MKLSAITIWQPWATLIVEGAKPYEFRGWPAPKRLVGQRIAIHAGARAVVLKEVRALLIKLSGADHRSTGLIRDIAVPILHRARDACAFPAQASLFGKKVATERPTQLPLSAILGVATLGAPTKDPIVDGHHLIADKDSDRTDYNWGYPLTEIERFPVPIPARGALGFWRWEREIEGMK